MQLLKSSPYQPQKKSALAQQDPRPVPLRAAKASFLGAPRNWEIFVAEVKKNTMDSTGISDISGNLER